MATSAVPLAVKLPNGREATFEESSLMDSSNCSTPFIERTDPKIPKVSVIFT